MLCMNRTYALTMRLSLFLLDRICVKGIQPLHNSVQPILEFLFSLCQEIMLVLRH